MKQSPDVRIAVAEAALIREASLRRELDAAFGETRLFDLSQNTLEDHGRFGSLVDREAIERQASQPVDTKERVGAFMNPERRNRHQQTMTGVRFSRKVQNQFVKLGYSLIRPRKVARKLKHVIIQVVAILGHEAPRECRDGEVMTETHSLRKPSISRRQKATDHGL